MSKDSTNMLLPWLMMSLGHYCWAERSEPIPLYMDALLNAGRRVYDKHSPPVQEADKPTIVRLAMYIEGMSSFRTQTMDFQLDVYFQQFWKDPRLAHNETRRVLVRDKEVLSRMWHPDVYFANARTADFHQVTQPNFLLWIEPDGSILYDTRISMVVVCTLNLEKWPLDSQRCHLRILSYAYTTDQLQIEWLEETPITRNPNIAMSDMHIVDLYPGLCDGNYSTGTWSCVTAEFFVKREVTHHVMQSYVPTTLIVVISWFSFWLDVDAVPARVSLAITTLLTLSTQANAARMALPEVSYMKAIDVWMGACMMFVFGVMIEFTIVNYAQRQASTDPQSTKKPPENFAQKAHRVFDKFRGRPDHRTLEEEDLLMYNGGMYDAVSVKNSENAFQMTSPQSIRKVDCDVELKSDIVNEAWRDRSEEKAERLANWANSGSQSSFKKKASIIWSRSAKREGEQGSEKKVISRWKQTLKSLQKSKKEVARRRAKQIDNKSRWVFPLSFLAFNAAYWSYYLHFKS
uniref:GABA/glycine receptor subunit ggr-2 n=2 Tax=Haemonchus contortus TaxID=6289 RepID=A0A4V1HCP6_HAECO|nr:GABA/glycine receptor subunit ggr-2 [Haemonchus contortus]